MDAGFTEDVLEMVETIPVGRVLTYGAIADRLGRGGPRGVGGVMAREGHGVPWWRVVRADAVDRLGCRGPLGMPWITRWVRR